MQALILAAGRGSRLGNKSEEAPKCLLEVGRRPIIEHQLEALAEAGVGPVGMVLGYSADEIKEVVGIRAEYIMNSRWGQTNSLYSFSLASDWVKGPLLILNSDIVFHPEVLDRLLKVQGDAFAYDSSSGHGREHMKVHLDRGKRGRLVKMSKTLSADEVSGENVGILSLTKDTVDALFEKARKLIEDGGGKNWLGSAVCEIAAERSIQGVDVSDLPWGEIDFSYDLDRVRREVWPAIRKNRKQSRRRRLARTLAAVVIVFLCGHTLFRLQAPPLESAWDGVDIESIERVAIYSGEQAKRWSLLSENSNAEMHVRGPTRVRIDSRLVRGASDETESPYVLEIMLDGKRIDWFKQNAAVSNSWKHPQWVVSKKHRITLDVPEGHSIIRIRLVASDSGRCLIRVHQEEPEEVAD